MEPIHNTLTYEKVLTSQLADAQAKEKFIKISAKRITPEGVLYKAHRNQNEEGTWLRVQHLPVQLVIDFILQRYRSQQKRKSRSRKSHDIEQY